MPSRMNAIRQPDQSLLGLLVNQQKGPCKPGMACNQVAGRPPAGEQLPTHRPVVFTG